MKTYSKVLVLSIIITCLINISCSSCSSDESGKDAFVDDGNGSKSMDSGGTGTDGDTDGDGDTDNDTDNDTDSDTDSDTDADADGDWRPPEGCVRLYNYYNDPFNTGRSSWSKKYVTWINSSVSEASVMLYSLQDETTNKVYDFEPPGVQTTSIYNEEIYFRKLLSSPIDGGTNYSSEVYAMDISGHNLRQITNNNFTEYCFVLRQGILMCLYQRAGYPEELRLLYIDDSNEITLTNKKELSAGCLDGDGVKVLFCEENGAGGSRMMIYDESDGGSPWTISETGSNDFWAAIDDGIVYYTHVNETRGDKDIWKYDLQTKDRSVLVGDAGEQAMPDADGYVLSYELDDSQKIILRDLETGVERELTPPVPSKHYQMGVHGKYAGFMHVGDNDELNEWDQHVYICDLEEGGFIDSDGHVIPEDCDGGK